MKYSTHILLKSNKSNSVPANNATRSHKPIPEIFLTRLLSTKGTLQKFVDDFFGTILKVPPNFPPPVKWLFDILDEAAIEHNVADVEVINLMLLSVFTIFEISKFTR